MIRVDGSDVNVPSRTGGAQSDGASSGEEASTCSGLLIWPGTGPPGWPHQFDVATTGLIWNDCPPASRSGGRYVAGARGARLSKTLLRMIVSAGAAVSSTTPWVATPP